ncbi:N-acetyltransferase family protein [Ramlibacter sp. MMS24-I3-19]|uniref:GNAT family N-acetyltransferase n=1 Tax=Ramlibacter sp. MMS24-I3-19 TaxID=3416606 RepID=UPI003D0187E7
MTSAAGLRQRPILAAIFLGVDLDCPEPHRINWPSQNQAGLHGRKACSVGTRRNPPPDNAAAMTGLTFRRLDPGDLDDQDEWSNVFRNASSLVYATEGRAPTDEDAVRMLNALPKGETATDVFLYGISLHGELCGCAYVARDCPGAGDACLVLLVLMEKYQRRSLGVRCLRWIEAEARSWECTRLVGMVDAANERAVRFWRCLGFQVERRQAAPGLVGEGLIGFIPLDAGGAGNRTAASRLRRTSAANVNQSLGDPTHEGKRGPATRTS